MAKKIFLSFGVATLLLITLDLFLRFAGISSASINTNDDILGVRLKPNKNLIYFNEGFYIGNTNEYGYYGPSYTKGGNNEAFRIALIGDSFVEGHQLFDRDHFRSKIEILLQQHEFFNKPIEVLNFGMSGFNINDDYCYYSNFVSNFNPNLSIIFISNEDFIANTNPNRRPIAYIENDEIKIDYSFRNSAEYKLRERTAWYRGKSIILGYLFKVKNIIKMDLWQQKLFDKLYSPIQSSEEIYPEYLDYSLQKRIIKELLQDNSVCFFANEQLETEFDSLFNDNNLIRIPNIERKEFYFWKPTKKIGHWNHEAHDLIAHSICDFIIEKK